MKRLLAVGLTLALIFGLVGGASAFDTQRVAVPAVGIQQMEDTIGGLAPKDECQIWMDNLSGWVWIFTMGDLAGCSFKKYVDPELGYTTCLPPYFPFKVDLLRFGAHTYNSVDTVLVHVKFDIEEIVPSPHYCGYEPGPVIYEREVMYLLPPGGLFWLNHYVYPGTDWCASVDGPFMVSFEVIDMMGESAFGWMTDNTAYGTTPCWNWLFGGCVGYPMWLEFYYDIAWTDGNLLFGVYGRPYWNVAVDMGSFEAVAGDGQVTLNWQSMSETNNQYWIVNRDGEEIARLDGQGNKETPTDYTYLDRNLTNGVAYSYSVIAVNAEGNHDEYGPVTATPLAAGVPGEFALSQNYPNPFNASTVIRYQLASDEHVTLKVYNVSGQEVASLVNADQKAGQYTVQWNGKGVSSGVYFYTLTAGDFSQTHKMVFTK
jgi:hypothetical protein